MEKIPCSVGILTFNSGATLERLLESVADFDEVIVCDGGSTDDTLSIARSHGARILEQDASFKNAEGTLANFAGARNQYLDAARNQWIFAIDSDECPTPELVDEIRTRAAETEPAAYWIRRLYVIDGNDITCNPGPASKQMRFFHRGAVERYVKPVHERIEPRPNARIATLRHPMRIPLEIDPAAVRAKWRRYIDMELKRRSSITLRKWIRFSYREAGRAILYGFRLCRMALLCRGRHAPWSYLVLRLWYHWMLIVGMLRIVRRL